MMRVVSIGRRWEIVLVLKSFIHLEIELNKGDLSLIEAWLAFAGSLRASS